MKLIIIWKYTNTIVFIKYDASITLISYCIICLRCITIQVKTMKF